MEEIRFHGRGGQGTVVASILLAKAFFSAGYDVQTFPMFGVERRGAPVEAYLRLDKQKILSRNNVYTPDHVVVQDAKLLQNVDVTKGLKPGGWVLLNTSGPPLKNAVYKGFRLAWVDATQIAIDCDLGTRTHPIINTAMVGAFAKMMDKPPLDMISETIKAEITTKTAHNIQAARKAYEQVTLMQDDQRFKS
jgi:pyruvate ferredoxin oxidoreductase gamma subunit/2-oxoisovalerate ferredoxin oxidoreductase gamma subunit